MHDLTLWTVLLLAIAAGAAGWVDAVSGGGGLLPVHFRSVVAVNGGGGRDRVAE